MAPASLFTDGQLEPVALGQGLLIPRFWLPVASGSIEDPSAWRLGLWVGGSSDLLLRSYYLLGTIGADGDAPELDLFFRGRRLAPWVSSVTLRLAQDAAQLNWGAERSLGPFWRVQAMAVGLRLLPEDSYLAGPRLSVQFRGEERTGRGLVFKGLTLLSQGAWFPPIGAGLPVLDGRVELGITVPSPLSLRQNLRFNARWRRLEGAPASALRLGGAQTQEPLSQALPERAWNLYRFYERMDGYEDQSLPGRELYLAGADLRHRVPLHFGRVYTGMLLPSLYFRYLELSAFGRYAHFDQQLHRSAGLELSLAMASGGKSPWTLFARGSWRFDLEDPSHFQLGVRY